MDAVFLSGIRVLATHGVLEQEKATPQSFEIDLSVYGDFSRACQSDDIGEAVDYSKIGEIAVDIALGRSFDLLEALSGAIVDALLDLALVSEAEVTVRKMKAPLPFECRCAGVTIRRARG